MAITISGTDGIVGAGFTVDASGVSVTAGVGTFGSLAAPAAGLTGALPAISAANLTNIPAANITGTLPAISGANLTGISAGITDLNIWYMTTNFTGGANPVLNWSKYSDKGNTGGFGSDMTESSGIWTFPSTGFWQVNVQAYAYGSTGHDSYSIYTEISTDSGSSYETNPRRSYSNIPAISGSWYSQNQNTFYYDITNVSTTRLKVVIDGNPDNINSGGTFARFMRLGDT